MIAASVTLNLVFMPLPQVTDAVRRTLSISDVKFSLLIGIFTAGPSMLMSVAGGWLTDRLSRKRLLIAAMALWTVGGVWTALAPTYGQAAASRILIGAAAGIKFPLAITWINDAFPPDRRGRAVGAFFVVLGIGPAIGASLAGLVLQASESGRLAGLPLLGSLEPWRAALLLLAAANLVVLPWVAVLKDDRTVGGPVTDDGGEPAASAFSLPVVVAVVIAVAVLGLADNANLSWLPTVLRRQFGYDAQAVGLTFASITTLGGIVGSLAGGVAGDLVFQRHGTEGRLWVCAASAIVSAACLVAYATSDVRILVAALALNAVTSVMAMTLGYVAFQALLPAAGRGFGIGLGGAVATLASSAGPTVVAFTAARIPDGASSLGGAVAIVTIAAFLSAASLYTGVAWRLGRPRPTARRSRPASVATG